MIPVNPAQIPAIYAEAMRLHQAGRLDAAEALYRQIVRVRPMTAEAHFQLGRIELARGRADASLAAFLRALEIKPGEGAIWQGAIAAARATDDPASAADELEQRAKASLPAGQASAEVLRAIDGLRQSASPVAVLRRKLSADGDEAATWLAQLDLARIDAPTRRALLSDLVSRHRPELADALMRRALKAHPHTAGLMLDAAFVTSASGQDDEALRFHDKAIAKAPKAGEPLGRKAAMLQRLGRMDEAEALLRKALTLEPSNDAHRYYLSVGRKFASGDPEIARWEARFPALKHDDLNRAYLGFALTKALEDCGQHDRVFTYLRPANETMKRLFPYDHAARLRDVEALKAAWDVPSVPGGGHSGFAPIFVTGMPRSGTTLVESILAAHSQVTGGGELGLARATVAERMFAAGGVRAMSSFAAAELARIGQRIEDGMRARFPNTDRITDKSVQTYTMLGPIAAALPDARFIVVHRDPRDTLLSNYRNFFEVGLHRFAYDQRDLAAYYRVFLDIVAFWKERMPDRIHEIRYEDLIADPEAQSRKLVAAAGLPWEDACLSFHESRRRVDTLSLAQVRQPIYSSSMKAWQRYEADLAEMFEALGDALPED